MKVHPKCRYSGPLRGEDGSRGLSVPGRGTAERWTIVNASRDWEHPIHIHLEEHQFEERDGATPPDSEQMRKDVALLRPGDSITLKMRFRDWLNEYPIHCHNTVHEDHAMMLLWEVVDDNDVACIPEP